MSEVVEAPPAAIQTSAATPTPASAPVAAPAAQATTPAATLATASDAGTQQATPGTQPAAATTAPASPEGDAGKAADAVVLPEKYEFKAPEGHTLDDSVVAAYSEVARELKLPQDAAQKIVDRLTPVMTASMVQRAQAFYSDIGGAPDTWATAAQTDKEFGGDKLNENLAVARKAMAFSTPELRALLDKTGMGNHPEIVRWMFRVGKAVSPDTFVGGKGGQAAPAPRSVEELGASLYK